MQEKSSRRITPSAVSAFFVLSHLRWCGTVPARWLRVRESSSAWPSDGGIDLRWSEALALWILDQNSRRISSLGDLLAKRGFIALKVIRIVCSCEL